MIFNSCNRIFFGCLLASLLGSSVMAEPSYYASVRGWAVSYNVGDVSCLAASQPNTQGTQLMFNWRHADSAWWVALSNPRWKLKVGQRIPASIYVDRDLLVRRRMKVVTPQTVVLPIMKSGGYESSHAFDELGAGRLLRVRWSGGSETQMGLYGSRAALLKLSECAGHVQTVAEARKKPRKTAVASYKVEAVPREAALVFVTNMFSKAGLTGFELLPVTDRENAHVVNYRLADGTVGSFSARRGQTASADNYVAMVTSHLSKACDGTFGSVIEKLPSTDGTVLRKLSTRCASGAGESAIETTVIRRPDGLLIDMTQMVSIAALENYSLKQKKRKSGRAKGLLEAALTVVK